MRIYVLPCTRQENSFALTLTLWLHDEKWLLLRFLLYFLLYHLRVLLVDLLIRLASFLFSTGFLDVCCIGCWASISFLFTIVKVFLYLFFVVLIIFLFGRLVCVCIHTFFLSNFFSRLKQISEFIQFIRQEISFWEEIIVFRKMLQHHHQVLPKFVFVCYDVDAWDLWNSLVSFDTVENIWLYGQIKPTYVKLLHLRRHTLLVHLQVGVDIEVWIWFSYPEIEIFSSFLYYWVLCIKYVY